MKNITYISAGAGSGKTYTLTHKMADLIKEGKVRPEQVILTTFTIRAAADFKEQAKACLYENGLFNEAARLDQALIGTIHSICHSMIGKYWFILGLTPDMNVMTDDDKEFYTSQSLAGLPTDDELEVLHDFCRFFDLAGSKGYDFWKEDLTKIIGYSTNYEISDFSQSLKHSLDHISQFVEEGAGFSFTKDELKAVLDEHMAFLQQQKPSATNDSRISTIRELYIGLGNPGIMWYQKLRDVIGQLAKCGPLAAAFMERTGRIWHSNVVYEKQAEYIQTLFGLAQRWNTRFAQFKREKNLLDFNDMEKYMRLLMQNKEVAQDISSSYHYLFVDEYQDSSPIQVKIFDALSELMEHSYWVGDYKQAIYGFRGSDTALTKAVVDRISGKGNGCNSTTIDTSYRSLPDIVDVCNDIFKKTFQGVLAQEDIILNHHRVNETNETCLRYFKTGQDMTVSAYVANMVINHGVRPKDIAVLAYSNEALAKTGTQIKEFGIPVSIEDNAVNGTKTCLLVESLLAIVSSERNALAKAQVAFMTANDYSVRKIIEGKLLFDSEDRNITEYLSEVPLVSKLSSIRKSLLQQSLSSMVESMVIELDLYNIAKTFEEESFAASCLDAIIAASRTYEQHAIQMNMPATIEGFIGFVEQGLDGKGDPDGVQLVTYHSSKGLQWPHVIMTSLNDEPANAKKVVSQEIYGIHADRLEQPSAGNPYPDVFIRVTPWIFGSKQTAQGDYQALLEDTELFNRALKARIGEKNRLLYVGMTRARNVLTLAVERGPRNSNPTLQWFKDVGITEVLKGESVDGKWDILGIGHEFTDYTIDADAIACLMPAPEDIATPKALMKDASGVRETQPRFVSPSLLHRKGSVTDSENLKFRIPLGNLGDRSMSEVGDCIHQIYAGIESGNIPFETVNAYGLQGILPDSQAIVTAWNNLTAWLEKNYGKAVKTYHERPFRMEKDGQLYTGSIDFVWQTNEGDILVDFKTCPMGPKAVLDPQSDHYAGWYAGQLDCYTRALTLAGENVIGRYIYYPVSGIIAQIGDVCDDSGNDSTEPESVTVPYPDLVLHIFDIEAPAFDKYMSLACKLTGQELEHEVTIFELVHDNDDKSVIEHETIYMKGLTTQGPELIRMSNNSMHIELPYLSSVWDVILCFSICKAFKQLSPACTVIFNDNTDGEMQLTPDNLNALVSMCFANMQSLLDSCGDSMTIEVGGIRRQFLFNREYFDTLTAHLPDNEKLLGLFDSFIGVQWNYESVETASPATNQEPDQEESYTMRILTNASDLFIGQAQKYCLFDKENGSMLVDANDFRNYVKGNKYVEYVDAAQFVIRKMRKDTWAKFVASAPGKFVPNRKTYLLRWNPAISSFTLDSARNAHRECPNGFHMDWSIFEHEQAHEGDIFYMLRTGNDNHAGIVWKGCFTSAPYQGDDWAGNREKKRMYVDIDVYWNSNPDGNPFITMEELQKALPDIDWTKGHSGELLSEEQTDDLDILWETKTDNENNE